MSRFRPTSPEARFAAAIDRDKTEAKPKAFVIPTMQADPPETDPTNLWMRWDGRLRGRFWNGSSFTYVDYPMRTDITSPPAVPASPAAPAQPAAPRSYEARYVATWGQGYKGDGTKRLDVVGEKNLPYGSNGDANGVQKSLIGFDYATAATDLASSTIIGVKLLLQNLESYWESGVDVYFGIHNVTAEPATWPSGSIPSSRISSAHFGSPESKEIVLPLEFATRLRAGTGKGIAIEAPGPSRDFYGYAAGVGSGFTAPVLIVSYAK